MCAHAEARAQIIARVAELLRLAGADENEPYSVRIEAVGKGGEPIGFDVSPRQWPGEAPAATAQRGLWLSHLERRIVDCLAGRGGHMSGEAVAQALGEPYQHRLKAILTNLCDREVIEVLPGSGYRLAS